MTGALSTDDIAFLDKLSKQDQTTYSMWFGGRTPLSVSRQDYGLIGIGVQNYTGGGRKAVNALAKLKSLYTDKYDLTERGGFSSLVEDFNVLNTRRDDTGFRARMTGKDSATYNKRLNPTISALDELGFDIKDDNKYFKAVMTATEKSGLPLQARVDAILKSTHAVRFEKARGKLFGAVDAIDSGGLGAGFILPEEQIAVNKGRQELSEEVQGLIGEQDVSRLRDDV